MAYSKRYGCIHAIGKRTNNRCHLCHEKIDPEDYGSAAGPLGGDAITVDHLWPQSFGGGDDSRNLRLAHARCNSIRGTRPVGEVRLQLAGTSRPPRTTYAIHGEMALGGVVGGLFAGAVFTRQGEQFNPGAAFVGAIVGCLLFADW